MMAQNVGEGAAALTQVNDAHAPPNDHLLWSRKTAAAMKSDLGYPPDLEPAIREELTVLASIDARYADELARLELSASPTSAKAHLRQQLARAEAHRAVKMA